MTGMVAKLTDYRSHSFHFPLFWGNARTARSCRIKHEPERVDILFFSTSGKNAMLNFKGMRFPVEVILVCIRWYAAYSSSTRNLEEMMEERGVLVDHSTVSRWAIRFLPLLEKVFRKHKGEDFFHLPFAE